MNRTTTVGAATAVLALGFGILGAAAPAQAHDFLVSSTPAVDSTISELPAAFSVTMNEDMLNLAGDGSGFALQVTDSAGKFYGDGCLSVAGPTLSMGSSLGEAGTYKVVWQIVSGDGHPTSGDYTFTWAPTDSVAAVGSATPPVCGAAVVDPTESATPSPEPTVEPSATAVPISAPAPDAPNPLAIGGAVLGTLAAGVLLFLIVRRRTNLGD